MQGEKGDRQNQLSANRPQEQANNCFQDLG